VALEDMPEVLRVEVAGERAWLHGEAFTVPGGDARGVAVVPGGGYVACDRYMVYRISAAGCVVRSRGHRLLADLHGVAALPEGKFAVVSAEADAVFGMGWHGEPFFEWWADEHGWAAEEVGHGEDFRGRGCRSAIHHGFHPNHVQVGAEGLLITGFGRRPWLDGRVLRVSWGGVVQSVARGLSCPHAGQEQDGELFCLESDTEGGCGDLVAGDRRWTSPLLNWSKALCPLPGGDCLVGVGVGIGGWIGGELRWTLALPGRPYSIVAEG
jgi:hypothetical protein